MCRNEDRSRTLSIKRDRAQFMIFALLFVKCLTAIQPVTKPNERWSLDFVSDTLSTERRIRALTIIDDFSRKCIAIEVDFSLTGARVATVLTRSAIAREAFPEVLKSDNGSEFTGDLRG